MRGEPEGVRDKREDESFPDYYLAHRDLEPSTERDYHKSWNRLEETLDDLEYSLGEIKRSEVEEICKEWEADDDLDDGRADAHLNNISRIVDWLVNETKYADHNPFSNFSSYFKTEERNVTEKIEIDLNELRDFIQKFKSHRVEMFVFIFILLKAGVRHSEALNLDMRDINLDHPVSEKMPQPRQEVFNYSDTLYVDSSISEGEVYNGEERAHGNKPRSSREIPIDHELKAVLVWWIRMCPPSISSANPLLRVFNDPEHRRPTRGFTKPHITKLSREEGYNGPKMKHFGFDAHWCRHWFTTQLRARIDSDEVPIGTPKEYVEGLRGDTGDDVIDTYTHDWDVEEGQKSYREVYEDNIPSLFPEG